MSSDSLELKCAGCGSKLFEFKSDPQPDDIVTCNGCGAKARYGDLRDSAIALAKQLAEQMIRDAFKGSGFKLS